MQGHVMMMVIGVAILAIGIVAYRIGSKLIDKAAESLDEWRRGAPSFYSRYENYEKYRREVQKHKKEMPKEKKICNILLYGGTVSVVIGILTFLIFGMICALSFPINKSELAKYEEKYQMIQLVEESGTELENVALSQAKIEFNDWLAGAKSSLNRWGNWSLYYYVKDEVLQLEYLT